FLGLTFLGYAPLNAKSCRRSIQRIGARWRSGADLKSSTPKTHRGRRLVYSGLITGKHPAMERRAKDSPKVRGSRPISQNRDFGSEPGQPAHRPVRVRRHRMEGDSGASWIPTFVLRGPPGNQYTSMSCLP